MAATSKKKPAPKDATATPRPVHDPASYALELQIGATRAGVGT
jgi:hypothetical protein